MFNLQSVLKNAKQHLSNLESGAIDAEILLATILNVGRAYLYTWPEKEISEQQLVLYNEWIAQRALGQPVAYLIGHKEFFGISLRVTPATLIPRPETERLVEEALTRLPETPQAILELGTGSGAISIALAVHRPQWDITATDISPEALDIAKKNGITQETHNIHWLKSCWFNALSATQRYHAIISNPPYLAPDRPELNGDLRYEPQTALVARDAGTADLKTIIHGAAAFLHPQGFLMLEHGYDQGEIVKKWMQSCGFYVSTLTDLAGHDRVSIGKLC